MGIGLDHTAKLAFVTGFPDDVSVALQQLPHIERMDVSKLLPTARLLVSKRITKTETVGANTQSNALRNKAQKRLSSLQYFRCRGPHYIKDCMEIPRAKVIFTIVENLDIWQGIVLRFRETGKGELLRQ